MTPALIIAISGLVTAIGSLVGLFVHKSDPNAHPKPAETTPAETPQAKR